MLDYANDGADLRWNAISMDSRQLGPNGKSRRGDGPNAESMSPDVGPARAALDRIEIPQDIVWALAGLCALPPLCARSRIPRDVAPPGSSRPSLTYTDQTLEASLPAITPCLNFSTRRLLALSWRCQGPSKPALPGRRHLMDMISVRGTDEFAAGGPRWPDVFGG